MGRDLGSRVAAFCARAVTVKSPLSARAQKLKARREAALVELSGLRRGQAIPASLISQDRLGAFCQALKTKLLGDNKSFAKRYLRLLVSEIRLTAEAATICGGYAALAAAAGNETGHHPASVPSFAPNWLPDLRLNRQRKEQLAPPPALFHNRLYHHRPELVPQRHPLRIADLDHVDRDQLLLRIDPE